MMRKNFLILNILILLIFSISGCVEETTKTATFIDKVEDSNTIPADFIPKQNLPGDLKLIRENSNNGTYINAVNFHSTLYRSEDSRSFVTISSAKYLNETSAKDSYYAMIRDFIEGFELMDGPTIQKAQNIELNGIPIERYTTVLLGESEGITLNLYAWQIENYVFLVSGASTTYNGDISLEMSKNIIMNQIHIK